MTDPYERIAQWGRDSAGWGTPQRRAAVGLVLAALLPDDQCTNAQRYSWASDALALMPAIAHPFLSLAWIIPDRQPRQTLEQLGLDPCAIGPRKDGSFWMHLLESDTPAIVLALALGNRAAIEQGLETLDPAQPIAGGRAAVARTDGDRRWQPLDGANWLAWSLFFQQWEIAEMLWERPDLRTQASLDRALFECVRGMVGGMRGGHHEDEPVPNSDLKGASTWIERLVGAGARGNTPVAMTGGRRWTHEWFYGPIQGREREPLEAAGWSFFEDKTHVGHPTGGSRENAPDPDADWSAARLLWREGTPALMDTPQPWSRAYSGSPEEADEAQQARRQQLSVARLQWQALVQDAAPEDWESVLRQLVLVTSNTCFDSSSSIREVSWPRWMEQGWRAVSVESLDTAADDDPRCLWLDVFSIHHNAARRQWTRLENDSGRALNIMGERLEATPARWISGLMRSLGCMALNGGQANLDRALSAPGLKTMWPRLPMAFQDRFETWAHEYRGDYERYEEASAASQQNSGQSPYWQTARTLREHLVLQRAALAGLIAEGHIRKPGPRL